MRRWTVLLFFLLLLALAVTYLFLPSQPTVQQNTVVATNIPGFSRALLTEQRWAEWWPVPDSASQQPLVYNGYRYKVVEKKHSSLVVQLQKGADSLQTELFFLPAGTDSLQLTWVGGYPSTTNPLKRWQRYFGKRRLQADLGTLLDRLATHYRDESKLYGVQIKKEFVYDSLLVSTAALFPSAPTTTDVYRLIDKLSTYTNGQGALISGYPMLNVTKTAEGYLTKVALPVNKRLPDSGDIQYRWMLGGGNILVTDVNGGPAKIKQAFAALEKYVSDHRRVAPAIPFESLVTDRRSEPDTSRWATRVYWPVM